MTDATEVQDAVIATIPPNTEVRISADGIRYAAMGMGKRVGYPYHLRWLMPALCGPDVTLWRGYTILAWTLTALLLPVYGHLEGLGWASLALPVFLTLGGQLLYQRNWVALVDPAALFFALTCAIATMQGMWWLAIPLALLAGCTRETAPVVAAVLAWSPVPLIGLAAPAVRALYRSGSDVEGFGPAITPSRPSISLRALQPLCDWRHTIAPWGACILAVFAFDWQVAAALTVGYVSLVTVAVFGMPCFSAPNESARVYQMAWPIVAVAAIHAAGPWWPILAITQAFYGWGNRTVHAPNT